MKPKEFWIIGSEVYNVEQLEEPLAFHSQQIHVIEKTAYDQLAKEAMSMRETLKEIFYHSRNCGYCGASEIAYDAAESFDLKFKKSEEK